MSPLSRRFCIAMGWAGCLVLLSLCAQVTVNFLFSARYFEQLLDEELAAEVAVEEVSINLFTRRLKARGVSFWNSENSVSSSGEKDIEVKELSLGLKVWPLFLRRIEATSLIISEPTIRMTLSGEGDWSLAELFRKEEEKEEKTEGEKELEGVLEAEDNGWLAKLSQARLEGGRVELLFEKERLLLNIEDLQIVVKDLQFNPEDLATLNQVELELSARNQLKNSDDELLMQLEVSGGAFGKIFNEESGEFDLDILAEIAFGENSYLEPRIKIVRRVWDYLDQVEKIGIRLGDLPERLDFGRSRKIAATFRRERITLVEPLSLLVGKWEVGLAQDSWIATESGQHQIGIEFLAGRQMSETLSGWFDAFPEEASAVIAERFVDEQQVLWRVESEGDLKDPDLEFLNQLPEAQEILDELEDTFEEEVDRIREKTKTLLKSLFD